MSAFTIVEGETVPVDRAGQQIGVEDGAALIVTQRGFLAVGWDGTNTRFFRVHDLDTTAGTEFNVGVSIRLSAPGGSVEGGTFSNPIRIDPTGTTAQPVTDNGGSLTIDTTQLPAVLVGGRLDTNIGSWLGSTAPTVGQKVMASSIPVVLASDQSGISVTVTSLVPGTGPLDLGKAEDSPHASGDVGVMSLAVRNDALVALSGTNFDYTPIAVTAAGVVRIDPSGTTAQPVTDNGGSLTVDTPQLPAALVGGRLDTNIGAWLGSTTPTVGQKTMASSIPVVLASDQTAITIAEPVTVEQPTHDNLNLNATIQIADVDVSIANPVPVSDAGGSLTVDTPQLPAALVGGRLDTNIGAWLGSTAPTVGQKTMAASVPVVLASNQTTIDVSVSSLTPGTDPTDLGKAEDSPHTSGDTGVMALAVRNDTLTAFSSSNGDYTPIAVTSAGVVRIDPSGTTAQPVTDNGGSLTVDTPQLPAALVGGRLDTNIGAWLGSTAPTVGQKTMAASVPVVIASDQTAISVSITSLTPGTGAANLGKAEDAPHTSGDVGVMSLAVRNDALAAFSSTDLDYTPIAVTAAGVVRIDPSGATAQPVTDNGGSLTVDGTVTANQGSANSLANAWPVKVSDGVDFVGISTVSGAKALKVDVVQSTDFTPDAFGAPFPTTGTPVGFNDGTNMQGARVFDGDTGAGTEYDLGVILRKSASGGSVEAGTATDPLRIDPTGTTTQPVSGTVAVSSITTSVTPGTGATNLGKAEDSPHASGDVGVMSLAVRNDTLAAFSSTDLDYTPIAVTASGVVRIDPTGTTTQPVSGSLTITSITPGTGATNLGKAEDSPHTSGDVGVMSLAVRNDTLAAFTSTDLDYSPIAVSSAGVVRIDPSGTTAQPVTDNGGSLTVDTPQLPAALVGGRLDTNIGAWLGSTAPTVGQKTMAASVPVVIASDQTAIPVTVSGSQERATFRVAATSIAIANNKSMLSIVNALASTVVVRIIAIYVVNVQTTGVTGVIGSFEFRRITGHSVGTLLTTETMDTTDALNASVTLRTGSTVAGESAVLLSRAVWSTDEWTVSGAVDNPGHQHNLQGLFPILSKLDPTAKTPTLRAGEGLTVKFATSSTAGSFDILAVLTQE